MRWYVAIPVAMVVVLPAGVAGQSTPARPAVVRAQTPHDTRIGQAMHWCLFNRPCNWTSHASIATGIVYGLDRLNIRTEYAAAFAALVFVGKEVRDHLKWGDVLGSPDSMGDMLSGFIGASAGYLLFRDRPRSPLALDVSADGGTRVGVRLPLK